MSDSEEVLSMANLVRWSPRWDAPTIRSACPSCGTVMGRRASSWSLRKEAEGEGILRSRMMCRASDCPRVFDVEVGVSEDSL